MNKVAVSVIALGVAAGAYGMGAAAQAQDQFVVMGTGGVTGVYYPTGGAIQRLVNAGRSEHGIRVSVESTGGSVYNLNALATGELDLAVVQSDTQYHAYHGSDENFPEPNENLRALFSLHAEPFTVVARADSGVETWEDLPGKRVNVSNPGSGARATFDVVMEAYGWTTSDFSQTSELAAAEQSQALCDNNFDVMAFVVGHPSGTIQEATTSCDTVLVDVAGEQIDQLVEDNPYYATAIIPGGMYAGNEEDTETFGVRAMIIATADMEEDVAYEIVRAVFDNFDNFRNLHPAFANLDPAELATAGIAIPLHDGAERYFREAGIIE